MKRTVAPSIFLMLLAFSLSSRAQREIDSLRQLLQKERTDTGRAVICQALSEMIPDDSAWKYYNAQALSIAEKNIPTASGTELRCFLKVKATSFNNLGFDETSRGNLAKALDYYTKSLEISRQIKNTGDIAYILNNIADVYETQGNISKALEYYDNSLRMHEQQGNQQGIAQAYNNIGFIYSTQGELDKALEFYEKSYKIKRSLNEPSGLAVSLSNIGYIYMLKKDDFKAMSYYMLALKSAQETGDKTRMALIYSNIAGILHQQGREDEALANYLKGMRISEAINDADGISHYMYNVGGTYLTKGNTDSALWYGTRAMAKAKEIGSPDLIKLSAELLKDTYKAKGNSAKALEYAELFFKMHDSINSEATRKATYKQQLSYEYEKREYQSKLEQQKREAESAAAINRQQIVSWSIGLGLLMVILFSVFLYKRFLLTQKQNRIIEEQKAIVDEKNSEILASINYAKRLQDAILPPLKMVRHYLPDSFVLFQPKDIVAGDFYWLEVVSPESVADSPETDRKLSPLSELRTTNSKLVLIAAADCTGHGVPGAMVSVVCSNALNRTVKEFGISEPGRILDKVRELVLETFEKSESEVKDGMDISLCSLNRSSGELSWAGANNPIWIIRHDSDTITEIKPDKQPIGKSDKPLPFTTHRIQLSKNDSVFIFTDGYPDQFGGSKGKKFKYSQLKEKIISLRALPMDQIASQLREELNRWKGNLEQVDDILIIGFRI